MAEVLRDNSILGCVIVVLCTTLVPFASGLWLVRTSRHAMRLPFVWICGQMLLWAVFQLVAIPFIMLKMDFNYVVVAYSAVVAVIAVLSVVIYTVRIGKNSGRFKFLTVERKTTVLLNVLMVLTFVIIIAQIICMIVLQYEEGDDAYYTAITTCTLDGDTMYLKLPYTGGTTELDIRHAMAPFPIWLAVLGRLSGLNSTFLIHIMIPIMLLIMAYSVYYLLAERLFHKHEGKITVFMFFVSLLITFGGYSLNSVENFLLVRTAQGKAVLGNIIMIFVFYLLMLLVESIGRGENREFAYWVTLYAAMIAGALCSTMGNLLLCMVLGLVGISAALTFKKWKFLIPLAGACVLPVIYAVLYFILSWDWS